eukprot:6199512-Pleurochrysis_carterae.AAC.3
MGVTTAVCSLATAQARLQGDPVGEGTCSTAASGGGGGGGCVEVCRELPPTNFGRDFRTPARLSSLSVDSARRTEQHWHWVPNMPLLLPPLLPLTAAALVVAIPNTECAHRSRHLRPTQPGRRASLACQADGNGFRFSETSLEELRREQRAFVAERDWERFHTPRSLALALVGEVGELCELLQWRGDDGAQPGLSGWDDKERERLSEELADVLSYVVRLADVAEIDLPAAFQNKVVKNRAKYPADQVRGSAKKYSEYRTDKRYVADTMDSETAAPPPSQPPSPSRSPLSADNSSSDSDGAEREWGHPEWVLNAYARAAARVKAIEEKQSQAMEESQTQQPSSSTGAEASLQNATAFRADTALSSKVSQFNVDADAMAELSIRERARLRAEAYLAAMDKEDAKDLVQKDAGEGESRASGSNGGVHVESLDDLYGLMEYGDGTTEMM